MLPAGLMFCLLEILNTLPSTSCKPTIAKNTLGGLNTVSFLLPLNLMSLSKGETILYFHSMSRQMSLRYS